MILFLMFHCWCEPSFRFLQVVKPGLSVPLAVSSCAPVHALIIMTFCLIIQMIKLRMYIFVFLRLD